MGPTGGIWCFLIAALAVAARIQAGNSEGSLAVGAAVGLQSQAGIVRTR